MIIIKWFQVKKKEIELKLKFYSFINEFIDNKQDIIDTAKNIFEMFQNTLMEDLEARFVSEIANLVHNDNAKEREDGSTE